MKNYQRLSMEVVKLNNEDVLTTSGGLTTQEVVNLCSSDRLKPGKDLQDCELMCGIAPNSQSCQDMFK